MALKNTLDRLENQINPNTQIYVIMTSNGQYGQNEAPIPIDINEARVFIQNQEPKPIFFNHINAAAALNKLNIKAKIYFFSDGLDHDGTAALNSALISKAIGKIEYYKPKSVQNYALKNLKQNASGFDFEYISGPNNANIWVDFYSSNHIILAEAKGTNGIGRLNLDALDYNIGRKIAYAKIRDAKSAGAVFLLDSFERRAFVGVEKSTEAEQPLLSDNNYIKAAAKQFGDIHESDILTLAKSQLSAIIIGDRAGFSAQEKASLIKYINDGGMLVRYIGPQAISIHDDELLTAPFKTEARNIKDALNVNPITIAPFERQSPFFGIVPPNNFNPNIIAVFDDDNSNVAIWARLSDGTPFISARKSGKGEIISIHTSAAPYWSDIAYSGLQPSLLGRIISRANSPILPSQIRPTNLPLYAKIQIDGFGNVKKEQSSGNTINQEKIIIPGIYENSEARTIKQVYDGHSKFRENKFLALNFQPVENNKQATINLAPWLLILAFLMFLIDGFVSLNGNFGQLKMKFSAILPKIISVIQYPAKIKKPKNSVAILAFIGLISLLLLPFSASLSNAQIAPKPNANSVNYGVRLSYLRTGDAANDAISARGLEGLKIALNARTSVQASSIVALDASKDELALYPIIYWRINDRPIPQTPEAQQKLNQYMRNGGLLFIDTRGAGLNQSQARQNTQIALRGLVVPPLEPIDANHVLAKSFYLLNGFPGRYSNAKLWAQNRASLSASANDGVSPIIIGDGDYAFAWGEISNNHNSALNVGINVYMYALTGQYKADQVHIPAILKRQKSRKK